MLLISKHNSDDTANGVTGACPGTCEDGSAFEFFQAKSSYQLDQDEAAIMNDIYSNGPVAAIFNVYYDLVCAYLLEKFTMVVLLQERCLRS